jgi:GNAT superfamily N-acetyltransferase
LTRLIEFNELTDVSSSAFRDAMDIYTEAIPAAERQRIDAITERISLGKERLYIGWAEGKVVFMALLFPLEDAPFVLLDYMAVKTAYRKGGIGSDFLKNIYRITGYKNELILIEVEDPKSGLDKEAKQCRVYFYRKNGAKILKNVRYLLPPLQGNSPTDMLLLVLAKKQPVWLSGGAVKDAIRQIYRELYCRDEGDSLLRSFIDDVPQKVQLG